MTNLEKYINTFATVFEIAADQVPALRYQSVKAWDSVGHMGLIAALEAEFAIMFDTDDIIGFSSFETGKDILKKYNVEL